MITEGDLRAGRVDRDDYPPEDVVARMAVGGHAEAGFCEKCWQTAGWMAITDGSKDQAGHYLDVCRAAEALFGAKENT